MISLKIYLCKELKNHSVLICGSYFKSAAVEHLIKCGALVNVMVYSETDLTKYTNAKLYSLHEGPGWVQHILRRTRGKAAGEVPEDEAFYRGFLMSTAIAKLTIEQGLQALLKDELKIDMAPIAKSSKEYLGIESELIKIGFDIQRADDYRAAENVALSGRKFKIGKYSACIVSASIIPVMPIVIAAAKEADIGISERYNQKEDITQVTFYTLSPDVNLSFVNKPPFEGGGRSDCKGKTFKGRVDVLKLCEGLSTS
jgi:hypothetical protein